MLTFTNYPQPPIGSVMPANLQTGIEIFTAMLATIVVIYSLIIAFRRKSPLLPLVVIGAAIAVLNEAIADVIAAFWHADVGQNVLYTMFDRPIPVWCQFAFIAYFGGFTMVAYSYLRRGVTRRQVWVGVGLIFAADFFFELPMLQTGMMDLYGPQPLEFYGLPIPWLFINAMGPVLSGVALYVFEPYLRGWRALGAIAIIPFAQYVGFGLGLPTYWVINLGGDVYATSLAGLVTIGAGVLVVDAVARFADSRRLVGASFDSRHLSPGQPPV